MPAIVFNSHAQFEALRAQNRYDRMSRIIVERDERLCGRSNQMLAEHGSASGARQYSGRQVEPDWVAPFEAVPPKRYALLDALRR